MTSPDLLATLLLIQPRMQLVFLLQGYTADSCLIFYPSQPPDPYLQTCWLVGPQLVLLHGIIPLWMQDYICFH